MYKTTALSSVQCKAARTYLDWDQEALSASSGLSLSTISSFEKGNGARPENVVRLRQALERAGIEFTDNEGVKRRPHQVHFFKGLSAREDFFQYLLDATNDRDEDILCNLPSPDALIHALGSKSDGAFERLAQLTRRLRVRMVSSGPCVNLLPCTGFEYREALPQLLGPTPYILFANRFAFLMPESRTGFNYVVFEAPQTAIAHAEHFEAVWDRGVPQTNVLRLPNAGKRAPL